MGRRCERRKQGDVKSRRTVEKSFTTGVNMELVKTAELKADKLEHYLQVDSCTFII